MQKGKGTRGGNVRFHFNLPLHMYPQHRLARGKSKVCSRISRYDNTLKGKERKRALEENFGRLISVENKMGRWHGAADERTDGLVWIFPLFLYAINLGGFEMATRYEYWLWISLV